MNRALAFALFRLASLFEGAALSLSARAGILLSSHAHRRLTDNDSEIFGPVHEGVNARV